MAVNYRISGDALSPDVCALPYCLLHQTLPVKGPKSQQQKIQGVPPMAGRGGGGGGVDLLLLCVTYIYVAVGA